jgi:hypothetical protein
LPARGHTNNCRMIYFLKDSLHVFIIAMIFVLGIGGALITGGKFDFWTSRILDERRRRLLAVFRKKKEALNAMIARRPNRRRLTNTPLAPTTKI